MSWTAFLVVYIIGGLTFLPISLAAAALYLYLTLPYRHYPPTNRDGAKNDSEGERQSESDIVQPGDDVTPLNKEQDADKKRKDEGKPRPAAEPDVAAGYFAVCREYTPMGINAKPIERSTPVGSATVAAPSQSVYQAMYRSIFDRKSTASPIDNGGMSQRPKRAGNVFYVVLRHGHLMLFDDDEQLEVRHVVSLAHHDVSIYSGGDTTPEGELYIKRNAICLSRNDAGETAPDSGSSKPFFLFSENCSAKEDFYFALLRNQEQALGAEKEVPEPLHFDVKDIISLVHRLHSSEDHLHTRWLNALIGRLFLSVYKTRDLENIIREKLTKKISRVKRPSFLTHIVIRDIHPGNSAPFILNPRLKELNVDGECVVEADVRYTGNFRIEVATTVRIDLGARFKVREVDLVLSVAIRKIEGHGLFKLKAPPSNRFWFSFQSMPKMEMSVEPIVSSRQITYTMIIRQIENRIKEVVAESIVLPYWDDTPFVDTERKKWRGGIWAADNEAPTQPPTPEVIDAPVPSGESSDRPDTLDLSDPKETHHLEKSYTDPFAGRSPTTGIFGRKLSTRTVGENTARASSISLEAASSSPWPVPSHSSPNVGVVHDSAKGEAVAAAGPKEILTSAAVATLSAMAGSPPKSSSPLSSPVRPSPIAAASGGGSTHERGAEHSRESTGDDTTTSGTATTASGENTNRRNTMSSIDSVDSSTSTNGKSSSLKSQAGSISRGFFRREDTGGSTSSAATTAGSSNGGGGQKTITLAAVGNAAIQARQWGLNAIQRHRESKNEGGLRRGPSLSDRPDKNHGVDLSLPMGRGRPLPPPGTPLPPPERPSTKITPRKPVPPPPLPERRETLPGQHPEHVREGAEEGTEWGEEGEGERVEEVKRRPVPVPPLPRRRARGAEGSGEEKMLVVAAPVDSEPGSPSVEGPGLVLGHVSPEAVSPGDKVGEEGEGGREETATSRRAEEGGEDQGNPGGAAAGAGTTAPPEQEDDDGYAGWMDDGVFEDDGGETAHGDEDGAAGSGDVSRSV